MTSEPPRRQATSPVWIASCALLLVTACGETGEVAPPDEPIPDEPVPDHEENLFQWPPTSPEPLLEDDPVGRALKAMEAPPRDWADLEQALSLGRFCPGSHRGVYLIEEAQIRPEGIVSHTPDPLPRFLLTGCPGDDETPEHEVFAVLISDTDRPLSDPLNDQVVELMGWHSESQRYAFYRLRFQSGSLVMLERFVESAPTQVHRLKWRSSENSVVVDTPEIHCGQCHHQMEPVLNELRQPWANWLSSEKARPLRDYDGITAEYIEISSRANALERVILAGVDRTLGDTSRPARVDWLLEESLEEALRPLFCPTTINVRSAGPSFPTEAIVDPVGLAAGVSVHLPSQFSPDVLVPVRGETDRQMERRLRQKGVVQPTTIEALRLVDYRHGTFSTVRCDLYPRLLERLHEHPTLLDDALRELLRDHLRERELHPALDLARALLDESAPLEEVAASRAIFRYHVDSILEGFDDVSQRELIEDLQATAVDHFGGPATVLPRFIDP